MKPAIICFVLWLMCSIGWANQSMDYLTAKNYAVLNCFHTAVADKHLNSGEIYNIIDRLEAWQKFVSNIEDRAEYEAKMSADQTIFSNYLQVKKLLPLLLYKQPYLFHSDNKRGDIRHAVTQVSGFEAQEIVIQNTFTYAIILLIGCLALSLILLLAHVAFTKMSFRLFLIADLAILAGIVYGLCLANWVCCW
ncbi:MAG: hypothetical protein V1765_00315 [bacterium]